MGNKEDLLRLFDRISRGNATDEDIREYNRWCHAFQEKGMPIPDIEGVKTGMLRKIRRQIRREARIHRLNQWKKIAAAFAVLVLAIAGYYLAHKPNHGQLAQSQTYDVPPGSNKAILTLSNGQAIMLNNVHNGQLVSQGNSRVMKVNNGLLRYNAVNAQSSPNVISYNTLTVPRGGQYQVILPDGTKVWLNAASSIRYPTAFVGQERKVEVTGEVYLEVAKDAYRPFTVITRHSDITVLGTHFNIMAYEDEPAVNTTLLEGSVRVSVPGSQKSMIIKPGEQASVDNASQNIKVENVNGSDATAWIHGLLSLNGCSVQEFMNQLSRWYDVDVEYAGKVPERKFGGMINRNAQLSDVLSALNAAGIPTRLAGKKIIVLSH